MVVSERLRKAAGFLLVAAFFVSIFSFFLTPVAVGDFWWHLNTGRWIVQHGALPDQDPFTYTVPHDSDLRRMLILRGYWLAQVVIYFIYTVSGLLGPTVLKAVIFTLMYLALWKNLTMRGLDPYAALLVMAPIPFITDIYDEPRPQVFSFLGVMFVFHVLEERLDRLRRGLRPGLALWLMPVFMLVWANIHRGYILGFMLIVFYMLDETVRRRRGPAPLPVEGYRRFIGVAALSLAAGLINPNVAGAFVGNLIEIGSPFIKTVDEFLPLRDFARIKHLPRLLYGTMALMALCAFVLFRARRRLRWHHLFLFSGFAFAGIMSGRFSIFMLLMGLSIAAQYVPERAAVFIARLRPLSIALLMAAVVFISVRGYERSFLRQGLYDRANTPAAAADFILSSRPPAPLLNSFEQGGYLGWRLYPAYRMFIDPRNLDFQVLEQYKDLQTMGTAGVTAKLDRDGINTVVYYPVHPENPYVPNIVLHALLQERWRLVYFDPIAVVFVREGESPDMPALDKQALWDHLLRVAGHRRDLFPGDPYPVIMEGTIREARGHTDEALRLYREALGLDPGNRMAMQKIEGLSETRGGGG